MHTITILRHAACFAAAILMTACSEELPGPDNSELYDRDFVKEFGEFKAESWSEARSTAITVITDKPTAATVLADVAGQRFMFASLGNINGTQPIVMNVPRTVKEFIVETDEGEYSVKPGQVLDLTAAPMRKPGDVTYGKVPSLGDFAVSFDPAENREIEFTGEQLHTYFNGQLKFCSTDNFKFNSGGIYNTGRFLTSTAASQQWMTVYPLYWRENRYGESDYMLGVYFYDWNDKSVIAMMDLEDFDVTGAIRTGSDQTAAKGQPYDFNSVAASDLLRTYGAHLRFNGIDPSKPIGTYHIGLYVKSGLLDTYTEGRGRDARHISYQNVYHNSAVWQDNYWNLQLKNINFAYAGAAVGTSSVIKYSKDKPQHLDSYADVYDTVMLPVGFSSQPDGDDTSSPDFCDCVFLVSFRGGGNGVDMIGKGEKRNAYPWYLAAEDLGTTEDWDFNDLVVTIYDITTDFTRPYSNTTNNYPVPSAVGRRIVVSPKAAGGTLPIYLMYEGEVTKAPDENTYIADISKGFVKGTYMIGKEMHQWLGADSHYEMLNTDGEDFSHSGRAVSFCVPLVKEGTPEFNPLKLPQDLGEKNQTMRGFWVLVDKNNKLASSLDNGAFDRTPAKPGADGKPVYVSETQHAYVPFNGALGQGAYRVDPPINTGRSIAPQMLMCHYTWGWPRERVKISDAYTSFTDWVQGKRKQWHQTDETGEIGEGTNGFFPHLICQPPVPVWME